MIKEHDYLFKIVLIGNSSVGKSSLLKRFTDQTFQQSYLATIGVDFRFKTIPVQAQNVKLQIWDTAGQQRFRTITGTYYKGAQGIIVVYDLTKAQSYEQLQTYWLKEIQKNAIPNVRLVLVGNKSDLQQQRQVNQQDVIKLCQAKNLTNINVSAKSGQNVLKAFELISAQLMKIYPKQQQNNEPMAVVQDIRKKRKQFQLQVGQQKQLKKQKQCCLK